MFSSYRNKFLFLIISLAIGIAAIIGVLQINFSAQEDLNKQLENFGANMIIYPKSDAFSLQYGGINSANLVDEDIEKSLMTEEEIIVANLEYCKENPDEEWCFIE